MVRLAVLYWHCWRPICLVTFAQSLLMRNQLAFCSLLQEAKAAGCKTLSGLEMFVGQAAEQFELFTGQKAPVDLMRQVVLQRLGS